MIKPLLESAHGAVQATFKSRLFRKIRCHSGLFAPFLLHSSSSRILALRKFILIFVHIAMQIIHILCKAHICMVIFYNIAGLKLDKKKAPHNQKLYAKLLLYGAFSIIPNNHIQIRYKLSAACTGYPGRGLLAALTPWCAAPRQIPAGTPP